MKVFLFGNTGIVNRGCEAIVRSSCKILDVNKNEITLHTYAPNQDKSMCKELGIDMITSEQEIPFIDKLLIKILNKFNKLNIFSVKKTESGLLKKISPSDYLLNIGGDTYCYGKPFHLMRVNKCLSNTTNTVLWCCSIENSAIDKDVIADLNRYKYILARESITFDNLIKKGIEKEKIKKVCDPAFFLDSKKVKLPECFSKGDTIGINVSECIIKSDDTVVYDAIVGLIRYILDNTNLQICLIPHVYSIKENRCDWPLLVSLKNEFNNDRISIIDAELTCMELKYIISHCRYMFAARTHASIAAYSSCVPTIVLGYSIKSKGIATDLFGRSEDYVLSYEDINSEVDLINAFAFLQENENEIKKVLSEKLPSYKKELSDVISIMQKAI